jgi:hypothetical protein
MPKLTRVFNGLLRDCQGTTTSQTSLGKISI